MTWSPELESLRGRVAVVAGATRGAGRGIAAALGEAGATVICTGRSTRAQGSSRSDYNRPERLEDTAELVTRLGGNGIAMGVDHLNSVEVEELADHIRRTHGHVDVLVNDIWGAEVLKGGPSEWNTPVWSHDLDKGLRILRLGIDTHLITSHHLLPLVIDRPGGLLVEVTDGTFEYNASHYRLQGSEFVIRLPTTGAGDQPANAPPPPSALDFARTVRVLVVDDNEDAADMLVDALSSKGYPTRQAHDGPAAIRVCQEFKPHVALLDIGLPVMDGYELAHRLRHLAGMETLRLYAVTGYAQESDGERSRVAGFERHFVKPLDVDVLDSALRESSESPRSEARQPDDENRQRNGGASIRSAP